MFISERPHLMCNLSKCPILIHFKITMKKYKHPACKNNENRSYCVIKLTEHLYNFIIIYTGFSFHLVDGAPTHYENLINLAFPSNMPSEEKTEGF